MADRYPEKTIRAQAQEIAALKQYIATLEAELEKYEVQEEYDLPLDNISMTENGITYIRVDNECAMCVDWIPQH